MTADWFAWRQFPDFKAEGFPEASAGPGVYELRQRSTGKRILVGESKTLAKRMQSLLPALDRRMNPTRAPRRVHPGIRARSRLFAPTSPRLPSRARTDSV